MTIDFKAMNTNKRKAAFNALLQCVSTTEDKNALTAIFQGQKLNNIMNLMTLREGEIDDMQLIEQVINDRGEKSFDSHDISVSHLSMIKDLKYFAIHLMTESAMDDITNVSKSTFEDWQLGQLSTPLVNLPAGNIGGGAPIVSATRSAADDLMARQISTIDKFDPKSIPHWNGSVGQYPRTMRLTRQVFKNFGMQDLLDVNFTPPANDGSIKYQLYKRRSDFITTAYMTRFVGGQASIVIRKLSNHNHSALEIYKKLIAHYESTANKTQAHTHIIGQLGKLVYNNRTNYGINEHLTKFQNLIQDLEDCNTGTINDTQIKSFLCNSIMHSAYTNRIDQYLSDSTHYSKMITDLTQKAERAKDKTDVSRRSVNNSQRSNNNNHNRTQRNGGGRNGRSKWWVDPETWATWDTAKREEHNRKKKAAIEKAKKERRTSLLTLFPPPTTAVRPMNLKLFSSF